MKIRYKIKESIRIGDTVRLIKKDTWTHGLEVGQSYLVKDTRTIGENSKLELDLGSYFHYWQNAHSFEKVS